MNWTELSQNNCIYPHPTHKKTILARNEFIHSLEKGFGVSTRTPEKDLKLSSLDCTMFTGVPGTSGSQKGDELILIVYCEQSHYF